MTKPPSQNIRLTITVTPEVHAAFQRMAEVSGMSLGRCMGEWLGDTLEGVEMITGQLAKARAAPRQAVREMRQGMLGMVDEIDELLANIKSGKAQIPPLPGGRPGVGDAQRPTPPAGRASAVETPRPVIRGGKSPGETRRTQASSTRGGKS